LYPCRPVQVQDELFSWNSLSLVVSLHNKEKEATVQEILSNMIDMVIAMKIELLTFYLGGDLGINNAEEMERTSAMLRRACEYIGGRSLWIATESTLSIQENRKLINQVNHPKMRILVDCYNGVRSGAFNGAEMVRELHDVLCNNVHAKDGPDDALIGQGDGDFLATAQVLKDIRFDGYIISETHYKTDVETRAATDLATLNGIFE
jgi:sugar phosphate isomerase/epimerase